VSGDNEPEPSTWRRTELFTREDIEAAVTRAGQAVYGNDERLDHLLKETRRFLDQRRSERQRGTDWD
jgi:hypothetical protein